MPADPTPSHVTRCWWAGSDPLLIEYHDEEWGRPVTDDVRLFEMLTLEGFQAGLSWLTILRRRETFRVAFRGFDPGIIRNRTKVAAAITNARASLEVVAAEGSFRAYLTSRVGQPPATLPATTLPGSIPATTPVSDVLSRDLKKRGFRFVGSTIVYSFMEAVGLVDDHLPGCFRYVGSGA